MKVCTDACVLGAWAAKKLAATTPSKLDVIDIGTGTGLLSLMLAQQLPAAIDAVELDEAAAKQANENVAASPWPNKIKVHQVNILKFEPGKKYDAIISNPPFFESDLKSSSKEKNAAKHDTALKLSELVTCIKNLLAQEGSAFILLPYHRTEHFTQLVAESGLHINEFLLVKQSPAHNFFRSALMVSKTSYMPVIEELIIHDNQRQYTAPFMELLQDYYLKF